jgi:hypothetical protein
MMGAVCTSETSVYSETTWRYIPVDSHLHIGEGFKFLSDSEEIFYVTETDVIKLPKPVESKV